MFALFKMKCILLTRDYIGLFFTIIFCPMLLVLFGTIYGNTPNPFFGGLGTVDISIPAYTGLVFAGAGLISMPVSIASSRERGELRRYQMTPVPPVAYLITDMLVYYLVSLIGIALIVLIGYFGWGAVFEGNILFLIAGLLLSGICIFSIGLAVASVSGSAKAAQAIGMVVSFPMMFLSGASMPLEMLPDAINKISKFMPLTYCVNSMRNIWVGNAFSTFQNDFLIMFLVSVVFVIISFFIFKWD